MREFLHGIKVYAYEFASTCQIHMRAENLYFIGFQPYLQDTIAKVEIATNCSECPYMNCWASKINDLLVNISAC